MNDDVAERDPEKCIGCGLCVSTCPSESLEMVLRSDRRTPPSNNSELMASIVASLE
jgi:electron transport complex protein RnfB